MNLSQEPEQFQANDINLYATPCRPHFQLPSPFFHRCWFDCILVCQPLLTHVTPPPEAEKMGFALQLCIVKGIVFKA